MVAAVDEYEAALCGEDTGVSAIAGGCIAKRDALPERAVEVSGNRDDSAGQTGECRRLGRAGLNGFGINIPKRAAICRDAVGADVVGR